MVDTKFLSHLQNLGVQIALHGDVHEMRRELVNYWQPDKKFHVLGAGTFGGDATTRPESMPRLYNLLEIKRDFSSLRVNTRCQQRANGPWKGWNEWITSGGALPYFDLDLKQRAKI